MIHEPALLKTKLYAPQTRADLVPRPRLLAKLNAGQRRKLILISAPAGYGKTTLATSWLSGLQMTQDTPSYWVSLDEEDSEPHTFFMYLSAAISPLVGTASSLEQMLQMSTPQPAIRLARAFVNDVTGVPHRFFLALDDYHAIESNEIDEALAFVIDHMPPEMTLVLTSRTDPGFSIARLRARHQLAEIRIDDLRFTASETLKYLRNNANATLSVEQAAALEGRTEGWAAGLQLAALSMQHVEDLDEFIARFSGSHRFIMDYLTDEVLAYVPPHIHDFLFKTSFLNRLSVPLCTALLLQKEDSEPALAKQIQQNLDYLDHANLFLLPLDNHREWYRYHHLFAELLQRRAKLASPAWVEELHRRASRWYEEHQMIPEALYHAHQRLDISHAVAIIVRHTRDFIERGHVRQVISWSRTLPDTEVRKEPLLSIGQAWDALYLRQPDRIESYLHSAEEAIGQKDDAEAENLKSEILAIRAMIMSFQGQPQKALTLCQKALAQASPENMFMRSMLLAALGVTQHATGDLPSAITAFTECLDAGRKTGNLFLLMSAAHQMSRIYMECGHLEKSARFLQPFLEEYDDKTSIPTLGLLYADMAKLAYERNQLENAQTLSKRSIALSKNEELGMSLAHLCMAQIHFAAGEKEHAHSSLDQAQKAMQRRPFSESTIYLDKVRTIAAINHEEWGLLAQWQQDIPPHAYSNYDNEHRELLQARVHIATQRHLLSPPSDETFDLLARIAKSALHTKRSGPVMEAHLLQALAYDLANDEERANAHLEKALELAQKEGFVRTFVDEGEPMKRLLKRATHHYAATLLAAFPETTTTPLEPNTRAPLVPQMPPSPLIEPLTEREIEILTLVAEGLKNKEIGVRLFISLNTVLYHTKNIYGKLGVNKRVQAIIKAQKLGLI